MQQVKTTTSHEEGPPNWRHYRSIGGPSEAAELRSALGWQASQQPNIQAEHLHFAPSRRSHFEPKLSDCATFPSLFPRGLATGDHDGGGPQLWRTSPNWNTCTEPNQAGRLSGSPSDPARLFLWRQIVPFILSLRRPH